MTPEYIRACAENRWHLQVWRRGEKGSSLRRVPYRCRSWRHAGPCREWCGACDFVRVKQAVQELNFWTYLVLTYPSEIAADTDCLFRWGVKHWSKLRKRIVYEFDAIKYIQTWEVHKSGKPHVNVLISNQALYNACLSNHRWVKQKWLEPALVETGWGPISWLSPKDNVEQMAAYLTKLARELTGAGVKDQVPMNAPRHFRRIRASRNTLPKRHKDPTLTGKLVEMPIAEKPGHGKTVIDYPVSLLEQGQLQFPKLR